MKKVLVITGQTATGKTKLGILLAKKFNGEIVSCDSRQIYQFLDIITGKDIKKNNLKEKEIKINNKIKRLTVYFQEKIPIWLYDLVDPKSYFSAFDYLLIAKAVIKDICKRNKLPVVVGGSIFYLKSLLEGLPKNAPCNWKLRKKLEKLPVEKLQQLLANLDKNRFLKMNQSDQKNPRRLIRAIEIAQCKNFTKEEKIPGLLEKYNLLILALVGKKDQLKELIKKRVEERLKQGALTEIKNLLKKGYSFTDPGLNTLGYQQLKDYFSKKTTLENAVKNWIKNEIEYTQRQKLFLNKIANVVFLNIEENLVDKAEKLVYKWYYETKN